MNARKKSPQTKLGKIIYAKIVEKIYRRKNEQINWSISPANCSDIGFLRSFRRNGIKYLRNNSRRYFVIFWYFIFEIKRRNMHIILMTASTLAFWWAVFWLTMS